MIDTIYVKLLNEGIDVWRPVKVEKTDEGLYVIQSSPDDDDEVWEFPQGTKVKCEMKMLSEGNVLVATEAID